MKKSDLSTKSRKLIYRVVMFACIAAFFSSIYAVWYLSGTVQRKIALADEQVIAYCPSLGSQTWLIFVILGFALVAAECIFCVILAGHKHPARNDDPAFSLKKSVTSLIIRLLVLAVLIGCFACFGLKGRNCIFNDGSIHRYNCFGKETRSYSVSDIDNAELYIRSSGHGKGDWEVYFGIDAHIAGEKYMFKYDCFHNDETTAVGRGIAGIENVLELWEGVPIVKTRPSSIKSTANYLNLNNEQREAFMKLFEVE